jgi:hypothetical protein
LEPGGPFAVPFAAPFAVPVAGKTPARHRQDTGKTPADFGADLIQVQPPGAGGAPPTPPGLG